MVVMLRFIFWLWIVCSEEEEGALGEQPAEPLRGRETEDAARDACERG